MHGELTLLYEQKTLHRMEAKWFDKEIVCALFIERSYFWLKITMFILFSKQSTRSYYYSPKLIFRPVSVSYFRNF